MIYFFYGQDEWGLKRELKKIESEFVDPNLSDLNIVRLDGPTLLAKNLKTEIMTVGFLSPQKLIIIENLFQNKSGEELEKISEILTRQDLTSSIVVLETLSPDKRTSLFKKLIKTATTKEFTTPNPVEIINRIEELASSFGSSITKDAAQLLSVMVPSDSLRLEKEVQKLSLYRYHDQIQKEDVDSMVVAETNSNVFDFVDNLARKNLDRSYQNLQKLYTSGLNEIYILSMIIWQYRQIIIVRDLLDKKEATAQKSGINPYVFGKVLSVAKNYTSIELIKVYQALEDADFTIKTGGQEPKLALELLAAKLCG